jgi:hypothetical protein
MTRRREKSVVRLVAAALVSVIVLLGGLQLSHLSNAASSATESAQSNTFSSGSHIEFSRPIVLLTGEALLAALVLLLLGGALVARRGATVSDLGFH